MIAFLEGILGPAWDNCCIARTTGGVGYLVSLPAHTFAALPPEGEKIEFYTCMVVREDAQKLYGFETLEERRAFEILRGVSKIGSRTALALLSAYRPEDLRRIVADDDVNALIKISGIGKKTAQHILLELKDKYRHEHGAVSPAPLSGPPTLCDDVVAALANLGYDEDECRPITQKILCEDPDLDASEAVRAVLKALAKGKA